MIKNYTKFYIPLLLEPGAGTATPSPQQ